MNERVKYPIVITLICLVAATALAVTFEMTKDRIAASKKSELVKGLAAVLPAARKSIEERPLKGVTAEQPGDDEKLYVARSNADRTGDELGYAAIGKAQGYSSKIEVMVGVDTEMKIIAIRILAQQETPGLGEQTKDVPPTKTIWRAIADAFAGADEEPKREPPFQKQFRGKTWNQLQLTKQANSKDAISQLTGATVTSQAAVNAVKDAITKIELAVHDDDGGDWTEEGKE